MKKLIKNICLITLTLLFSSCNTVLTSMHTKKTYSIRTTAYCVNEGDHKPYGNKNAMGTTLKDGHIACDWSIFPVNTKLKIGGKVYLVTDYGRFITRKTPIPTIDVFQKSRYAMNKWGVRYFNDVEVVEWGSYEQSLQILKRNQRRSHVKQMINNIEKQL